MRRAVCILLAMLCIVSLAACGSNSNTIPDAGTQCEKLIETSLEEIKTASEESIDDSLKPIMDALFETAAYSNGEVTQSGQKATIDFTLTAADYKAATEAAGNKYNSSLKSLAKLSDEEKYEQYLQMLVEQISSSKAVTKSEDIHLDLYYTYEGWKISDINPITDGLQNIWGDLAETSIDDSTE